MLQKGYNQIICFIQCGRCLCIINNIFYDYREVEYKFSRWLRFRYFHQMFLNK